MASHYASDEAVRHIMNAHGKLSKAQYVYTKEESEELFFAVLHEINWIFNAIPTILKIQADIHFAVVASLAPYQVVHLGNGSFVVLVDHRAFYMLLTLCHRVQTLPPFSDYFGFPSVICEKCYDGKFLIDIVKDFVFHTDDVSPYLAASRSRLIYQAANAYIIGHEIAHVAHGHLEFIVSSDFAKFSSNLVDRNLTMRTLEMDADSSAATSVIDVFERFIDRILLPAVLAADKDPIETRDSAREQYVAGMFIALMYLDSLSSNFTPAAYPISYARFLTTFGVTQIALTRNASDAAAIPDSMRKLLVAVFERLSGSIANLAYPMASNIVIIDGGVDNLRYEYHELGILAGQQHLQPLYGRWAAIRPFLEKFQRGGRLAPAQASPL